MFKTDMYIIFNKSHKIRLKSGNLRFCYGTLRKISILRFETFKILENKVQRQKLDTSSFPISHHVSKIKLCKILNNSYKLRSHTDKMI